MSANPIIIVQNILFSFLTLPFEGQSFNVRIEQKFVFFECLINSGNPFFEKWQEYKTETNTDDKYQQ